MTTETAIRRYAPASRPPAPKRVPSRLSVDRLSPAGDWWPVADYPGDDLALARRLAESTARTTSQRRISLVRVQRWTFDGHTEAIETVAVFVGERCIVREATTVDTATLDEFCRLMHGAAAQ